MTETTFAWLTPIIANWLIAFLDRGSAPVRVAMRETSSVRPHEEIGVPR
jgi:hypothetical protein